MGTISLTLPSDGETIDAQDVNNPFNTIANAINGNLDSTNISSLNGTKINAGTLPATAFDTNAASGWLSMSQSFTYGANNGSKEFTVTTANDLSSVLSPGMRMKFTRGTVPPTQAMAFASASSQYATKASPSGITFTGAFSCEAWVYLNSYTGNSQYIVNRMDSGAAGGGWRFDITSVGQVEITYGTTTSFTNIVSSQSIPLNRWVHIAGVITSVGSKTGAVYINGSLVTSTSTLTAATTLTQASVDLRLGAAGGTPASTYFNGYMSEVRVWSAARTQQNILDNMAINLVGNETNLVALYQGNGNFNDSTANANNLTQSGGAIATQAANPYNSTEYATIIAVSYSNPTTTITLDCGNQNTIPNQTLSSPYYSTVHAPVGFPTGLRRYKRTVILTNPSSTSNTTATLLNGLSLTLTVPSGTPTVRLNLSGNSFYNANNTTNVILALWDGTVGSGVQVGQITGAMAAVNQQMPFSLYVPLTSTSGSHTYNVDLHANGGGQANVSASTTSPTVLSIECDL